MQIQVNEEDWTVHQILKLLEPLRGRRCFFRLQLSDDPTVVKTVVADTGTAYSTPDFEVRINTSEGVITLGEIISIEPYQRFTNDGKDRYS